MRQYASFLWADSSSRPGSLDGPNALLSLEHLQAEALKAMFRYHIEAMRFLKSRLEQNLRLVEDIQSDDHLNDAFDVWSGFWQGVLLDYSMEGARMATIGSRIATILVKRLRRENKLLVENMALQMEGD